MAKYAIHGSYTKESWTAMVGNPEDRSIQARRLVENVGGKLESFYWCFGEDDFLVIAELPNDEAAGAISLAVSSSGTGQNVRTTKLITVEESIAMLMKAKQATAGYAKPGAGSPVASRN